MSNNRKLEFRTALVTGFAIMAFTFFQRYHAVNVSAFAFFVAAAVICLLPVGYGLIRRQLCLSGRRA